MVSQIATRGLDHHEVPRHDESAVCWSVDPGRAPGGAVRSRPDFAQEYCSSRSIPGRRGMTATLVRLHPLADIRRQRKAASMMAAAACRLLHRT